MSRAECLSPLASNESECLYWLAPLDLVVFRPIGVLLFFLSSCGGGVVGREERRQEREQKSTKQRTQ